MPAVIKRLVVLMLEIPFLRSHARVYEVSRRTPWRRAQVGRMWLLLFIVAVPNLFRIRDK